MRRRVPHPCNFVQEASSGGKLVLSFQLWSRHSKRGVPQRFLITTQHLRNLRHRFPHLTAESLIRLAITTARQAVNRGNQTEAMAAESFIDSLGPSLAVTGSLPELLARDARRAVMRDAWTDALAYTEAILALDPHDIDARGRALRNRATALSTLGRFEAAVNAYDTVERDEQVMKRTSPEYRSGFRLARACSAWYLGPVDLGSIESVPPYIGAAPSTWLNYWWLMGHIAWREFPERLPFIREGSLRTFGLDWPMELDRALWGLDLLGAADADRELVEQRVLRALEDPETVACIGRASWLDLYADWLTYVVSVKRADAAEQIRIHIAWCDQKGYDGWSQYWRVRLAAISPMSLPQ